MSGPKAGAPLTRREKTVLAAIQAGKHHIWEIAGANDISIPNASQYVRSLIERGLVERICSGQYRVAAVAVEAVEPKKSPKAEKPQSFIAPLSKARLMGRRA